MELLLDVEVEVEVEVTVVVMTVGQRRAVHCRSTKRMSSNMTAPPVPEVCTTTRTDWPTTALPAATGATRVYRANWPLCWVSVAADIVVESSGVLVASLRANVKDGTASLSAGTAVYTLRVYMKRPRKAAPSVWLTWCR